MENKTKIFHFSRGKIVFFKWKNEENWPVEYVSPSVYKIFGYKPEDFLSGQIIYSNLIHPDDIDKVIHELNYASTHSKDEFTHEVYRLKDSKGKYRYIYDHTQIIRNSKNEIIYYQGYISDETDIIEQKERMELVLAGTDLGLWDWNPQTNDVVFDERWANMLGYKLNEINPSLESWESRVHPDDLNKCFEDITAHMEGKSDFYNNVHRMMHKDGKWRYILDRGKIARKDDDGNPIRFTGTHTDITYIKETENKLQEKQKKIDQYVNLIDKYIITSSTDLKGKITYVSDAFCEISGYSREELLGKNHRIVRHKDMPKKLYEELWETISNDKTWIGEIKNKKKDGSSYWVKASISPIFDDKHNKIGYTAIRQDITDKKKLEEISITDGLTNIYNRRYFNEVFPKIINSAKRENELVSFLIMDIDHFKQYNDTYGHQMGDEVLIKVASTIKDSLHRADDFCFRLGGEEFGVIFKVKTKKEAEDFSNKIRRNIENLQIEHSGNSASAYVTASMGLISKNANEINSDEEIYKQGDDLLYKAKDSGRNKIESL